MRTRILVTIWAVVFAGVGSADAGLINGDFETGDFTGWTTFTTVNGILGIAEVVPYDTRGDGAATRAAAFRVGERIYSHPAHEGGGLYQNVTLGAGALTISAEIASLGSYHGNFDGGLFKLLFDGQVVASHDFGLIDARVVERASLFASFPVSDGAHEVRLLATRPWLQDESTPLQFFDNVDLRVDGASITSFDDPPVHAPEPGSLTLLGLGLLGIARARRKRSR